MKNYVFHLNYYETEKIKKTKLVWHQILHYVTHLFQNLTNFDRDITKSRISSFSTFSNFCPWVIEQAPDGGMVKTEVCSRCGTHIFSENVESLGVAHL